MKDKFIWDDEKAIEFARFWWMEATRDQAALEKFKSSKAPKKEWEIVAFRHARGTMDVYKLREDGKYRSDETPTGWGFTMEEMIKDEEIIHSARRLSDDIIFSCQERVDTPSDGRRVIEGFEIDGVDLLVKMGRGFIGFSAIRKLPSPLFVTTDGKELFVGDKYFALDQDWCIREFDVDAEWISYKDANKNTFSTREAAETYILNNRPLLSLNDVKSVLDSILFASENTKPFILEVLTNAVKQKLNS